MKRLRLLWLNALTPAETAEAQARFREIEDQINEIKQAQTLLLNEKDIDGVDVPFSDESIEYLKILIEGNYFEQVKGECR